MSNDEHIYDQDELLARWLAGELSDAELEALRKREDFAELEAIVEHLRQLSPPDFDEEKNWEALRKKMAMPPVSGTGSGALETAENIASSPTPSENAGPSSDKKVRSLWTYAPAIAAVLVVGVLAWLLLGRDDYPVTTKIATGPGEKKELKLPDGSEVVLNASSSLGYSEENWKKRRYAVLNGEAFFKAKKGRQFTVHTEQGDVVVVGTQFNVYARESELEVKCLEGKVQVINPEGTERVLLKQKEQVSVINGRMQKRQGLAFYPTWQKGESSFKNAPIGKVLTDLKAQYGLVILADSLGQRSFSGKFVHGDLQKAVKMVCQPLQLNCTLTGDTLRIGN
jgi:ferric-dicitrate binding protein FerR (iron transport regulator)